MEGRRKERLLKDKWICLECIFAQIFKTPDESMGNKRESWEEITWVEIDITLPSAPHRQKELPVLSG